MRIRFLLVGTVAAAIVMFAWQTVSNAALPWYRSQMLPFQDDAATVAALRASAPHNALYYSPQGVFAALSIEPGVANKATELVSMMEKQIAVDLIAALGLCLLLLRLPDERAGRTAITFALAAGVVTLVVQGSSTIWYGMPRRWGEVSVIDQAITFFLAGLTVRGIARKTMKQAGVSSAGGVRAEGGLGAASGTPARTQ